MQILQETENIFKKNRKTFPAAENHGQVAAAGLIGQPISSSDSWIILRRLSSA
jgi:hypothetical protein